MNLTPVDVEQKAFTQALRGYQMDEVDDFLDEVVLTLRSYEQRLRESQDKIRALESNRGAGAGDESEISRAIISAQRSADRLVEEARSEAETIRREAEEETNSALEARDAERTRLTGEMTGMRDLVGTLRSQLSALAAAVNSEIDQMEANIDEAGSDQLLRVESTEELEETETEEIEIDEVDELAVTDEVEAHDEAGDDESPSFSDIFPEEEVTGEEAPARVSSRPWERG